MIVFCGWLEIPLLTDSDTVLLIKKLSKPLVKMRRVLFARDCLLLHRVKGYPTC